MAGLTKKQREAIIVRDMVNGLPCCMFPHREGQQCEGGFEVHHIRPQRWSRNQGATELQIHDPANLITICKWVHQRIIHPDMAAALRVYHLNRMSFSEAFALRERLATQGIPYWNTAYDFELAVIARHRTEIAIRIGWTFPEKPTGRNPEKR